MEEEDISLFLSDDSSDEEIIFKKVPVHKDNNPIQTSEPILDDQIDAVEDIGQVKPILENEDKEMEEEILETVPEQAPDSSEGAKQQDQAEIIQPILEKDDKEVVDEPLDTVLEDKKIEDEFFEIVPEQAPVNEVAKQKYQLDQAEAVGEGEDIFEEEEKEKEIVEEALNTVIEQAPDNDHGAKEQDKTDQAKPILEEMEEELSETIPEDAPVNEVVQQKYQLDQAEAIGAVEDILEEEDKEIVYKVLDTVHEQAPENDHGAKQQNKTEDSFEETIAELEAVIEDKNEIMLESNIAILPEHDSNQVDESDTNDDTFNETIEKIDDDRSQEAVELLKDAQLDQVSQNEPDTEDLDDEVILKTTPVIEDKIQETSEAGDILKEPVDDNDTKDSFNEYVGDIVSENDDQNQMVLDNFQPEHNNPCNDEGSKKESKNDSFIESVDIIEKDESDNDLPKQVASDEIGAKQDDITDKTTEKILSILDDNKVQMQEPNKLASWDGSANPQHDKTVTKQDNDKHDITDETIEKIIPNLDENKIQMQEPIKHAPWNESANPPQDNDKYESSEEIIEKILPILEGNEIQMEEPDAHWDESANLKLDEMEQSSKTENSNENDDNLEFTFDEIEAVMDNTEVNI